MSNEYISAIVILIVTILKALNIEVASDAVSGLVTGVLAIWIAYKRYSKGDITVLGKRL